jgi:hypothetical protein
MNIKTIPRLYVQWLATVDQGMQVEVFEADVNGEELVNGLQLARVFADEKNCQWLELYIKDSAVRVPLLEFLNALQYSEQTVKNEKCYNPQSGNI